jgi:superfamily II DNA or RNA helicase
LSSGGKAFAPSSPVRIRISRFSNVLLPHWQFLHAEQATRMADQQSPQAGSIVVIRRQRWRVVSVRAYPRCKVLALVGVGIGNAGRATHLISPFDDVEAAARGRIRLVSRRSWRRRCRALLATSGPSDRLQTVVHARIDLLAHQLEPALAMLRGLACRVLIADEVGLGKTVQAGLIAGELRERGMADRILVIAPSGLREQWAGELKGRFNVDATVMDASSVRKRSSILAVGLNPWATVETAIASFDYVKRPEVLPAITACRWDAVIVDEAHGAGPGTDRLAALQTICGKATYVVLVTATPHNGNRMAFDALCGIGSHGDRLLIFRRTRDAMSLTPGRNVHRLAVTPSGAERELHATLANLAKAVANEQQPSADAWLTIGVFQKRAFSSAYAIAQTVARRLETIEPSTDSNLAQLLLPLVDAGEPEPADDAPQSLSPVLRDAAAERRLLVALVAHAAAASPCETKLSCLGRLLRRLDRLGEPTIVFTEYRDTLLHVRRHLACECAVLHGGLSADDRRAELDKFRSGSCRVLLATDAAGEGLNLQSRCRTVVNLELPWNPMRLEQRIGRVDRIGQKRRVHAFHLIAQGTGEMRILEHLRAKVSRARTDVAASDPLGFVEVDDAALARVASGVPAINPIAVKGDRPHDEIAIFGHLELEAASELRRLVIARRFSTGEASGDSISDECLATAARRAPTRMALNGRTLAVIVDELRDGCGRPVAVQLLPLLATLGRHFLRKEMALLIGAIEGLTTTCDDGGWLRAMAESHEAFIEARRQRDAAILDSLERRPSPLAQVGLFDRRALREAEAEAGRDAELKSALERSLAMPPMPIHVRRTALVMTARW